MRMAPWFLLLLSASFLHGCGTLAGVAIGLGIDASQPDSLVQTGSSFMSLSTGTEARMRLVGGTERHVIIGAPDLDALDVYEASIEDRQRNLDLQVPVPPAEATIRMERSTYPHARLEGYDREGLWITLHATRAPSFISWSRLKEVAVADGNRWTADSLRRRSRELGIPSRTGRWVQASGVVPTASAGRRDTFREFVRTSDVEQTVITPSSNAVWWGLAAGVATDLVIAAIAVRSMSFDLDLGKW